MDFGTLLLNLVLLGLVGYLIARPLLKQGRPLPDHSDPAASLAAERDRLLAALRDLELDHATGKVDDDDYAQQRPLLVAQGAAVLRQLDELAARTAAHRAAPATTLDDEIEAAVQQVRQSQGRRGSPAAPKPQAPASRACPACGRAARAQDRFCAGCGAPLAKADQRAKPEAVR